MDYVQFNAFLDEVMKLPVYRQINDRYTELLMSYKGWKTEINLKGLHSVEEERMIEAGRRGDIIEE